MSAFATTVTGELSAALDAELCAWQTPGGFDAVAVPWSRLSAAANSRRVRLSCVEVRRAGRLVGAAIVHVVRGLAVGDYTGGALQRVTAWGRRVGYTPLAYDVAYLEIPFANRSGLLVAPDATAEDRAWILNAVLAALEGRELAADALCVKSSGADARSAGVLAARGMSRLPFVDNHVLELPSARTYDAWLATLSVNRRSHVRRNVRRFEASGATLAWAADGAADAPRLAELYARTAARAHARGELPVPMAVGVPLFAQFAAHLGERGAIRLALHGGELIGFLVHLYTHDTLFMRFVGLDYASSPTTRAYFRLFYDGVEEACRRGLRFVDMGTTTADVKVPLGCVPAPTHYHVQFRRRLRLAGVVLAPMLRARFGATSGEQPQHATGGGDHHD